MMPFVEGQSFCGASIYCLSWFPKADLNGSLSSGCTSMLGEQGPCVGVRRPLLQKHNDGPTTPVSCRRVRDRNRGSVCCFKPVERLLPIDSNLVESCQRATQSTFFCQLILICTSPLSIFAFLLSCLKQLTVTQDHNYSISAAECSSNQLELVGDRTWPC